MSVLIRGMKKPKNCCYMIDGEVELCPFVNTYDDCVLQPEEKCYGTWEELYAGCPLGELPEKHGDLIDRDVVKNAVYNQLCIKGEENLLPAEKAVFGQIVKAEAVIEAEGEG